MRKMAFALLAAVILTAAAIQNASAASATYNWSGWYVGLNAGGAWGKSNVNTDADKGAGYFAPSSLVAIRSAGSQSPNTSGFTGGILGGFNVQIGNIVGGIELDFEYFGQKGSSTSGFVVYPCCPGTGFTINSSVKADWLFTARPRLGVATANWLFYGTGGLAVTTIKANWTFTDTFAAATESASMSTTKAGWTIGGGIESALPGKWSLGVEYLHVKFGSVSTTSNNLVAFGFGFPTRVFTHSADLNSNIVRVRLNKLY